MPKTELRLAALALLLLGGYGLIYGDFIRVRWTQPFCVGVFWFELALGLLLALRIRRAPLLIGALLCALAGTLLPTAVTILSWTDWLLQVHVPWY